MYTKIFIRTFPSDEECELFESLLKTRWLTLLEGIKDVSLMHLKTCHRKPLHLQVKTYLR